MRDQSLKLAQRRLKTRYFGGWGPPRYSYLSAAIHPAILTQGKRPIAMLKSRNTRHQLGFTHQRGIDLHRVSIDSSQTLGCHNLAIAPRRLPLAYRLFGLPTLDITIVMLKYDMALATLL